MANPKLEGAITIPTAGWSASVTDGTGTETVTVPGDGYCFLSSAGTLGDGLVDELEDQLNATMTDSFTVTMAEATGLVTITNTSANNTSITWTDTDMRDVLGFTGNVSGSAAYTGSNQAKGLWLPDSPYWSPGNAGADAGWLRSDFSPSRAPNGAVHALYSNSYRENELKFDAFCREKCWQASESTTNESLERFVTEFLWGEATYGSASGPLTWYPDRSLSTFFTYGYAGPADFRPTQRVQGLAGIWSYTMTGLFEVPS